MCITWSRLLIIHWVALGCGGIRVLIVKSGLSRGLLLLCYMVSATKLLWCCSVGGLMLDIGTIIGFTGDGKGEVVWSPRFSACAWGVYLPTRVKRVSYPVGREIHLLRCFALGSHLLCEQDNRYSDKVMFR
jgi:hypothetical protein